MKIASLFGAAILFLSANAMAEDTKYLISMAADQVKTVKVELPEGKSDLQIASYDEKAVYKAQVFDTNGDEIETCSQVANGHTVPCVLHVAKLALPVHINVKLTSLSPQLITVILRVTSTK